MKKSRILVIGVLVCLLICSAVLLQSRFSAEAQRNTATTWRYAAITGTYTPYPADNPSSTVSAAVNICYMGAAGCENEEVAVALPYAKFMQDQRLENTERSRLLARNRAVDNAYSKAIAKLGSEGWELVSEPNLQFDLYYLNPSGGYDFQEGNRNRRADIYFKRSK